MLFVHMPMMIRVRIMVRMIRGLMKRMEIMIVTIMNMMKLCAKEIYDHNDGHYHDDGGIVMINVHKNN